MLVLDDRHPPHMDASSSLDASRLDGERRYLALFNSIDQGFCTIDVAFDADDRPLDYRFVEVSPSFARQTGIENGGGRWMREIAPNQDEHWFDIYGHVSLTGEPRRFEEESTPLGRWWSVYAFRIDDWPRGRIGVLFNDITERKRAEAALRRSDEAKAFLLRLGDTLRPVADPREVQRLSAQLLGEYLAANRVHYGEMDGDAVVIERGYGHGLPPMIGRFHQRDFGERLMATLRSGRTAVCCDATTDPTITEAEKAAFLGAGFRAYVAVPLIKGTAWIGTLATHIIEPREWTPDDISMLQEVAERTWAAVERTRAEEALARSEEKYRTLFNSIDEGLALQELFFDRDGHIVDVVLREVNQAYLRQGGLSSAVGTSLKDASHRLEQTWRDAFAEAARTRQPIKLVHHAPDPDRWFDVDLTMLTGSDKYVAMVFRDITARKRRESSLAFLNQISRELERLTSVDEIIRSLGPYLGQHFAVSRCDFGEFDGAAGVVRIVHAWNRHAPADQLLTAVVPLSDVIPAELVESARAGEIIVVRDQRGSSLTMPYISHGQWVAALSIADDSPREWRDHEMELMREVTWRVWTRLRRTRAEEALRDSEDRLRQLNEQLEQRVAARTEELAREVQERRAAQKHTRHVLSQFITVQEDERRRIARDIHDNLGQMMTGLHLKIDAIRRGARDPQGRIAEIQAYAQRIDKELHFFTWELRPAALYNLGLTAALRDYVVQWMTTYGIETDFDAVGIDGERFASEIELNLYRIAQEALNNVHKHARATHVSVLLQRRRRELRLIVEDNGVGFVNDVDMPAREARPALGLSGMRERSELLGGDFEVDSSPDGTTVIVTVVTPET